MSEARVLRELKRDALGAVELLDGPRGLVVRRLARGGRWPGSRLIARRLMARERAALMTLTGLSAVCGLIEDPEYARAPSLDGRAPRARDVLLRRWIEGRPLYAVERLPEDFFERLAELVAALHARGVTHNDLHKEPNILVGARGAPALIDFQLASVFPQRGARFEAWAAEDRRHIEKHRRVYFAGTGRATPASAPPKRRGLLSAAWMRTGKPLYNFVTRSVLRTKDGEPRRPRDGPWPEWTEALGPGDPD